MRVGFLSDRLYTTGGLPHDFSVFTNTVRTLNAHGKELCLIIGIQ